MPTTSWYYPYDPNPWLTITQCPTCGVWDYKGAKHDDDCPNG